ERADSTVTLTPKSDSFFSMSRAVYSSVSALTTSVKASGASSSSRLGAPTTVGVLRAAGFLEVGASVDTSIGRAAAVVAALGLAVLWVAPAPAVGSIAFWSVGAACLAAADWAEAVLALAWDPAAGVGPADSEGSRLSSAVPSVAAERPASVWGTADAAEESPSEGSAREGFSVAGLALAAFFADLACCA